MLYTLKTPLASLQPGDMIDLPDPIKDIAIEKGDGIQMVTKETLETLIRNGLLVKSE